MSRAFAIALTCVSFALAGCELHVDDGSTPLDSTADDAGAPSARAVCVPLCDKLQTCGLVGSGPVDGCVNYCTNQYDANAEVTTQGSNCALRESCMSAQDLVFECPGAPVPN